MASEHHRRRFVPQGVLRVQWRAGVATTRKLPCGSSCSSLVTERRGVLNRRSLWLAYATAGYNLLEGAVAVAAGAAAASAALIGFGLDSFVEVSSALVVIWQFHSRMPEARERLALKLIAVCFFALAGWVTFSAEHALLGGGEAEPSLVGIALAVASLLVMPLLAWAKRRTGRLAEG